MISKYIELSSAVLVKSESKIAEEKKNENNKKETK